MVVVACIAVGRAVALASAAHSLCQRRGAIYQSPFPLRGTRAPSATSLGLPGNWDPAGSPGSQYLRWTHEYVLGAADLATGMKRPRLRDGVTWIALKQAIRDIIRGDPAFQCPTPATVVRHGGDPRLASVVMAA